MKRTVRFPLAAGKGFISAEVEDESKVVERGPRVSGVVEEAKVTFEAALDTIQPIAAALMDKLASVGRSLTEVSVEFDLKMNAETGLIIASGGVEANFRVSLKFKPNEAHPTDDK
jgi:hypothetical protein